MRAEASPADAIFKTRMKLERMFRDGLDPYAHPT